MAFMLRAIARDRNGRPTLVLGLTEANWNRLHNEGILFDASEMGIDATVIILGGSDIRAIKLQMVELGLADRSLLDLDESTKDERQWWKRSQ